MKYATAGSSSCPTRKKTLFDLPFPQCDGLKMELQELQVLYDSSQRERAELEEELLRCRAELEKLSGGAQVRDGSAYQQGNIWIRCRKTVYSS